MQWGTYILRTVYIICEPQSRSNPGLSNPCTTFLWDTRNIKLSSRPKVAAQGDMHAVKSELSLDWRAVYCFNVRTG